MNRYNIDSRWNKQKLKNGLHTITLLTSGLLLSGLLNDISMGGWDGCAGWGHVVPMSRY